MAPPRASVVVTTYTTPTPLLALGLSGLLAQSLGDVEVVLVVDGELAPDAADLVADLQDADRRLVVLEPGRVGRARALNLGLRAASAPYVGIQDADDASHPRRLEVQVAALDARPDLAGLGTGFRVTSSLTETADWPVAAGPPHVHEVGRALLRSNPIVHSSVLLRQDVLEVVGGYDERRSAQFDYDLLLRIQAAGHVLALCEEPLVLHRRHPDQFFEGLSPVRRAWGSYRLQAAHIRSLSLPGRLVYGTVAAGRFAYQVARGVVWHRRSRRARG